MISTAGHEFRKLSDAMYVNGKRVQEVWANGVRVYPETGGGNFVKFAGRMTQNMSHTHEYEYEGLNWDHLKDHSSSFTIDASFVATLEALTTTERLHCDRHYGTRIAGFDEKHLAPGYISYKTEIVKPLIGLKEQSALSVWCEGGRNRYRLRCLIRFNASQVPLCGPVYSNNHSMGGVGFLSSTTWEETLEFHEKGFDVPEFNGRVISFASPIVSDNYLWTGKSLVAKDNDKTCTVKPLEAVRGEKDYAKHCIISGLNVSLNGYMVIGYDTVWNVKVGGMFSNGGAVQPKKDDPVEVKMNTFDIAKIPITKCLFVGDAATAPDWAKNLYASDLLL